MSGDREPTVHYGFGTRAVHAGEAPDPVTGATVMPIYQNATFAFRSAEQIDAFQQGKVPHYAYSRDDNPTVRTLELKLADLEGTETAIATASGMAAISAVVLDLCQNGGHLIVAESIYPVARTFFEVDLPQLGASVTSVDTTDLDAVEGAFQEHTRGVYTEVFSNPDLRVADVAGLADLAHARDAQLVVDNTFLSPAILRPVEHGADIVIHSATKYLAGHGNVLGGVIAGSRSCLRPIAGKLSRLGGAISPHSAWLVLNGIKTLSLRVRQQSESALVLAAFLAMHPAVERVNYPGLPDHPGHDLAKSLTGDRYGGMVSFSLRDHATSLAPFLNALQLPLKAVSLGDVVSLIWPFEGSDLIRLSVGIEDTEDLLHDFRRALAAIGDG